MSFVPDADTNYKAYLTSRNTLSAEFVAEYEDAFIKYLCAQATATGTLNAAMITAAITQALATAKKKVPTF
jgi:hypothetical protein